MGHRLSFLYRRAVGESAVFRCNSARGSPTCSVFLILFRKTLRLMIKAFTWNLLLTALVPCLQVSGEPIAGRRPNIVFVLTDDQGYGDMSCHGHPILKTPSIDRLNWEGVRFVDFHVSPTCSPTRSALMTGRHEFRNGVTHTILERERLTLNATTLAQVLQSAGYATAIFGKWHLGDEPAYRPNWRGFDEVFIHGGGGIGQTYPGSCGDAPGNTYFDRRPEEELSTFFCVHCLQRSARPPASAPRRRSALRGEGF